MKRTLHLLFFLGAAGSMVATATVPVPTTESRETAVAMSGPERKGGLTYDSDSDLTFDGDGNPSPLKALTDPHLKARYPEQLARALRHVAERTTDTGLLVREQPFQGDGLSTTRDAALMARALGAAAHSPASCGCGPEFAETQRVILQGFVDRWRAGYLAGWYRPNGTPTHYRLPQELADDGTGRRMRHMGSEQEVIAALAHSGISQFQAIASEMQADLERFVTPNGLPRYLREEAPGSGVWLPAWELPKLVNGRPVVTEKPGSAYANRPTWTPMRRPRFETPEVEHRAYWMARTIKEPNGATFSLAVAVQSIRGLAHEIKKAKQDGDPARAARAFGIAGRWIDRIRAFMPAIPNEVDAGGSRHSHGRAVMTDRQVACWQASAELPSALWMLFDAAPAEMARAADTAEEHVATLASVQRHGWWAWAMDVPRDAKSSHPAGVSTKAAVRPGTETVSSVWTLPGHPSARSSVNCQGLTPLIY